MKYFSAITSLIILNKFALTVVLYFGSKTKIVEEENKIIVLNIEKTQEQLKINEVEHSLYHNYLYLNKLKKIYFDTEKQNNFINSRINLNDFANQDLLDVLQVASK